MVLFEQVIARFCEGIFDALMDSLKRVDWVSPADSTSNRR
jgi:hypothetical protein